MVRARLNVECFLLFVCLYVALLVSLLHGSKWVYKWDFLFIFKCFYFLSVFQAQVTEQSKD